MYDVVIVGAGPAGLFAAYELLENNKELKVAILDRGFKADKRVCPMNKNKSSCVNCNPCGILSGYGGAGTFWLLAHLFGHQQRCSTCASGNIGKRCKDSIHRGPARRPEAVGR